LNLKYYWQGLLELVYPPRRVCSLCGSQTPEGKICNLCRQWVRREGSRPVCPVCGRFAPVRDPDFKPGICRACRKQRPSFNMARAVAPYTGPLRDAVLGLKSRGTLRVAAALGELMAGAVLREPAFAAAEVIVPVPLTRKRLAGRGFNQACLLALELGRVLDMPVNAKSVVKVRETRPQTGLSRLERENNLIDAFSVVEPAAVGGKKVLLVDDVFTTGATVENISLALKRVETEAIFVITAAGGTC